MKTETYSCIAHFDALERRRKHSAMVCAIGSVIRAVVWAAVGGLVVFASMKSHAQQFTAPDHQLPPDPLHLSPADTSPGADPKRGLDNLPEATEERYMAFGGILFVSVYFWASWLDRRNKRKI